eukprot:894661-Amphidinium_carterae.2
MWGGVGSGPRTDACICVVPSFTRIISLRAFSYGYREPKSATRPKQRGRKGVDAELNSDVGRCPLECVNCFVALDRELNNDQAEFFSAPSDKEQVFAADSEEATCAMGVGREQLSSKGREQLKGRRSW